MWDKLKVHNTTIKSQTRRGIRLFTEENIKYQRETKQSVRCAVTMFNQSNLWPLMSTTNNKRIHGNQQRMKQNIKKRKHIKLEMALPGNPRCDFLPLLLLQLLSQEKIFSKLSNSQELSLRQLASLSSQRTPLTNIFKQTRPSSSPSIPLKSLSVFFLTPVRPLSLPDLLLKKESPLKISQPTSQKHPSLYQNVLSLIRSS